MQGLGGRTKTTLTVLTGLGASFGVAFLAKKTASRFFFRYLSTSQNSDWKMTIKVASNEKQCDILLRELKRDLQISRVLGFDCEWTQTENTRDPVALVQLATQEGNCGLFQIGLYSSIPTLLKETLADKSILKVGVSPNTDCMHLQQDHGIEVAGTLDIRHLAENKDLVGGLAALAYSELGVKLSKQFNVRCSDWKARNLTNTQIIYAANDAFAAILTFNRLVDKKVRVPFFSSKEDQWEMVYKICEPLLDIPFKEKRKARVARKAEPFDFASIFRRSEQASSARQEESGVPPKRPYSTCALKSSLYDNAYMLAPDGEVLCTCSIKKAEWYISKDLATIVESKPLKIKIKFEPAGRMRDSNAQYYTFEKEDQCVTCGGKDTLVRKKVVPHEYRKHFPESMKKHQSHDVLLLCAPCHAESNKMDLGFRLKLATLCNAPIAADGNSRVVVDDKRKSLRSAARALLNKSVNLPEKRRKQLSDFIQESFQLDVTPDLLNRLKDMDIMSVNEDFAPHGLSVVAYFSKDGVGGLMKLEKMWRQHFLYSMVPQHLPPLWSVDHSHENVKEYFFDSDFLNGLKRVS